MSNLGSFLILSALFVLGDGRAAHSQAARTAQPPAPGKVPPNASRVTASILEHKACSTGSLLCSLRLKIESSAPANASDSHLAESGRTIEAFLQSPTAEETLGQKISATLSLAGDTNGVRWLIKDLKSFP